MPFREIVLFIAESTIHKWFSRFENNNFDLQDGEGFGRPIVGVDDRIKNAG